MHRLILALLVALSLPASAAGGAVPQDASGIKRLLPGLNRHHLRRHLGFKVHVLCHSGIGQPQLRRSVSQVSRQHDVGWLDSLLFEAGAFYLMDRGYMDFSRLILIANARAFFVTRAKSNLQFTRHYSKPVDRFTGLRSDYVGKPTLPKSRKAFPVLLRRVRYYDSETSKELVFLTNNLEVPALTVAMLYKARWSIELFFRWIKGHLRIKHYRRSDLSVVGGVTAHCETNIDLTAPWTPATGILGVVVQVDDNFIFTPPAAAAIDRVRVYVPRGSNTARFARLKAVVP